ncbi:zinc dependent phospholipase C family protein [Daejeonella oryzae]|uniref:zinc dependent phospholipase C family protein n=1 Tax=Daejeonella oryzae TaxID=1122943 RepID=UPI000409F8A1|nr:zinc dependent phospholipase C family protein [Daejeonella oryzae]
MKKLICNCLLVSFLIIFSSWGFFAHQRINRLAVFTLPKGMIKFYKSNINFITEHAVDPDKRRYADSLEAPRHFIDADRYGNAPFESVPEKWKDAVAKYGEKTLTENGIVPWQIERTYYSLVKAFQDRDSSRILRYSADLGHYIGDAHVPLHTTENYNGQLTNQVGIHGFWESRLPELFSDEYDYFVGKSQYIENPLKEAWSIVKNTYLYKDSVLLIEARLNKQLPSDKKYTFSERKGKVERQYSEEYSRAYHLALNGMVEQQMRSSILKIGSFWYSAWVDAGQPNLKNLRRLNIPEAENHQTELEEKLFKQGKIIGREEN